MDDMNATPVTKLSAPMLSDSRSGGGGGGGGGGGQPPSYTELLKEMQDGPPQQPRFGSLGIADSSDEEEDQMIEDIQELPPRSRAQKSVRFANPIAAMQPVQQQYAQQQYAQQQYQPMMQGPMQGPMQGMMPMAQQPKAGRPPKAKGAADGIKGLLLKHKTVLVIAFAAFLAMVYGAPKLRSIPQFVSSSGGLNMLGIAALSLAVGASSELAKFIV